jgi:hypothetical protein
MLVPRLLRCVCNTRSFKALELAIDRMLQPHGRRALICELTAPLETAAEAQHEADSEGGAYEEPQKGVARRRTLRPKSLAQGRRVGPNHWWLVVGFLL